MIRVVFAALGFGLVLSTFAAPTHAQQRVPVRAPAVGTQPHASATPAPGANAVEARGASGVVNINTAGDEELQRLPGIGPARAAAIVALRQRVQRFRAVDDLMRVRGIGRASMRQLRPLLVLQGDTTLVSRPGRPRRSDAD